MLELPGSMRALLVEHLEEYCENLDDTSDTDAIAEAIVEVIEATGQEATGVDAEEIVSQLEASGELDATLIEVLDDVFSRNPDFDYTAEEIVGLLEKLCEIEWLNEEEEEEAASFFSDGTDPDEDF